MRLNPRSLRFQLIAWYAGLLAAVCLVFGAYAYSWLHHYLRATTSDTLVRRIEIIEATLLSDINQTGEPYVIRELQARYAPAINDRFIRVIRPDGSVMYVSGLPGDGSFDPVHIPLPDLATHSRSEREVSVKGGGSLVIVTDAYRVGGQCYLLEVGASLKEREEVMGAFSAVLGVGLPVVILIVVAGGYFLISQALRPVKKIVDAAQTISLHHLDQRLPVVRTGDEIEALSVGLNEMIARLEDAFRHASRFSSDASHEMRTPLTIVRGELEAIIRNPQLDPGVREAVGSVLEEAERLAKLVEGLFAISRLESGEATMEISRFDLSNLVLTTADQIRLLAEDREIRLTSEAPLPVEIAGDRARLKQVVVNLLDNAIKYTPQGGAVHLSVRAEASQAVFRVTDNGKGIAPAALPFLFDRFYRADDVRTQGIEGTGLGLSIVRSICLAHGGSVEAVNEPQGGCSFIVRLPLPTESMRGGWIERWRHEA